MSYSPSFTYIQRATMSANPTARELFLVMEEKRSNLCVALDVNNKDDFLRIARDVAPHICVLKTHIDIINDFDIHLLLELQELSKKKRFLVFEDRKFADIGKTVVEQYENGMYKIANWSDMVTVHSVAGPGTVEGLRKSGLQKGKGALLLAEMSSEGSLATGNYTEETVKMAKQYSDFVIGFITQKKLVSEPHFINMTPGVNLDDDSGAFRQQYRSPKEVIVDCGSDVIIVGSGIVKAENPAKAAQRYQEAGWSAYEERVGLVTCK
ncbi:MAG: orotidine-5'-phosphate decarboxylase [Chlamydiota bacterium]|nr:orotidine-5'-phosphate decarboxylase [Chlamydiota bacterium]